MTRDRIKKLAEFFYSSNNSNDVPLRIAIVMGMGGNDLSKEAFCQLMLILENSIDLKKDLLTFRDHTEDYG
jgi:hypothetical protein